MSSIVEDARKKNLKEVAETIPLRRIRKSANQENLLFDTFEARESNGIDINCRRPSSYHSALEYPLSVLVSSSSSCDTFVESFQMKHKVSTDDLSLCKLKFILFATEVKKYDFLFYVFTHYY